MDCVCLRLDLVTVALRVGKRLIASCLPADNGLSLTMD